MREVIILAAGEGTKFWPYQSTRNKCMFSIANKIAYSDKMISAKKLAPFEQLLASSWFDVPGDASELQYVPAQGEFLCQLLSYLCRSSGGLPAVYIITPYKKVKKATVKDNDKYQIISIDK